MGIPGENACILCILCIAKVAQRATFYDISFEKTICSLNWLIFAQITCIFSGHVAGKLVFSQRNRFQCCPHTPQSMAAYFSAVQRLSAAFFEFKIGNVSKQA